jgi:hypothetical protein
MAPREADRQLVYDERLEGSEGISVKQEQFVLFFPVFIGAKK